MSSELALQITASCRKNGATFIPPEPFNSSFDVLGNKPLSHIQTIGLTDEVLTLGEVGTPGYLFGKNKAEPVIITTPVAPTVTNLGTPGAATWSYKIVALDANGAYSAASTAGTTTTGNATLDGTNKNHLVWPAVTGAATYNVYRTAHGTTPSTDGKIASVTSPTVTYDDIGGAGDATTAPATAIDNIIQIGSDGSLYPNMARPQGYIAVEWNAAAIHLKSPNSLAGSDFAYLLLPK